MFMLPHRPFIWRQQLCSSALIRAFGKAQAIVGASSDKNAVTAMTIRRKPCILNLEYPIPIADGMTLVRKL